MNKKQEALRRGLRSFIEDTSKELADLEGRPLRPPENPTDTDAVGASDAVVDAEPERAADTVRTSDTATRTPDGTPRSSDAVARTMAAAGAISIPPPPKAGPGPVSALPEPQPPLAGPPQAPPQDAPRGPESERTDDVAAPERPAPRRRAASAAPAHPEKPKRRAPASVRRRPAAEIGADGVNPAQAHARKGVCFAYFLNHECWRVADAYCNSALQVCITRECPIYHLHKDAFERRFARKFKHFW